MAWQGPREFNGSLGEFRASFAGHGSFFVAVVAAVAAHRLSQSSRWPSARSAELARGRRGVLSARRRSQLLQRRRYLGSTGDRPEDGHDDSSDGGDDDDGKIKPSSLLLLAARRRRSLLPSILRSCWRYRGRAFTRERVREGDGDSVDVGRLSLSRERESRGRFPFQRARGDRRRRRQRPFFLLSGGRPFMHSHSLQTAGT